MSSHQEEEAAGPSGLAHHDIISLLGLEMSDSEPEETNLLCPEEMGDSEEMACRDEDDICQEALDRFERQRVFQTQLLQQSGGGLDTNAEGAFEFELERFVDRRSDRMGVQERHFNTQLRQRVP